MLNTIIGWHARTNLGCRFDVLTFTESIAAGIQGYTVTLTNALNGTAKKNKMSGHNFIVTEVYTVCSTGIVDARILPDNDTGAEFWVQPYQPYTLKLPSPVLLMTDIVLMFNNNEAHINNAYVSFSGFWINEDRLAEFTLLAETIPATLSAIDVQTFTMMNILKAMAENEGVIPPDGGWVYEGIQEIETFREFCKRKPGARVK